MIRIGICDDSEVFCSQIERMVEKTVRSLMIDSEIFIFRDGIDLWNKINDGLHLDIVYLDIEMQKMNGVQVAEKMREYDQDTLIIFISEHQSYVKRLFEVEPFRFLEKPISEELFKNYTIKAYERIIEKDACYEYRFNKILVKVPFRDILYFESEGRTINLITRKGVRKFYGKLNEIEEELRSKNLNFLRIHKSYLVNYRNLQGIGYTKVIIEDGTVLNISKERQKEMRQQYSEILKEEFDD